MMKPRATLVKQIETKKKSLDRAVQDCQEDAQTQQKEIFSRILQKMAPMIVKHAQDNGFQLIVDTSNPWPQSPVLWYGEGGDITKAIVDAYNASVGCAGSAPTGAPAAKAPAEAAQRSLQLPQHHPSSFSRHRVCRESSRQAAPKRGLFSLLHGVRRRRFWCP